MQLPQIEQAQQPQQAALPRVPQPQVQEAVAMPFSLGPGRDDNVLDFTAVGAKKHYSKSIVPLKEKFDGTAENFITFLSGGTERAQQFGWTIS